MANTAQSLAPESDAPALLPARAAGLLAELRQAHQDLLGALAALEELTAQPTPDAARYPGARWRLSLASRKRRQLTTAACAELLHAALPGEAVRVARLKGDEAERLRDTATHVQKWTTAQIAADWAGYCAASAMLRAAMRRRITAEQALLYPLLEKYSR